MHLFHALCLGFFAFADKTNQQDPGEFITHDNQPLQAN